MIDILMELSLLSQHMCSPREAHIDTVYCIFRHLYNNLGKDPVRRTYNPMYEPIDDNVFEIIGRYLGEWK